MSDFDKLDFENPDTCPNCGQFVGQESMCPYCGAILYDEEEDLNIVEDDGGSE